MVQTVGFVYHYRLDNNSDTPTKRHKRTSNPVAYFTALKQMVHSESYCSLTHQQRANFIYFIIFLSKVC